MAIVGSGSARDIFITGAQNLHAVEKQATQLLNRQVERLEHYPQLAQMLRTHSEESQRQAERLDAILQAEGSDNSLFKDTVTQIAGNLAAIGHSFTSDEVMKNYYANQAFENYEIAAYTSLMAIAEASGFGKHNAVLEQSLNEEKRTAQWLADHNREITLMYLKRSEAGQRADV